MLDAELDDAMVQHALDTGIGADQVVMEVHDGIFCLGFEGARNEKEEEG
jgi:hypothetical protein